MRSWPALEILIQAAHWAASPDFGRSTPDSSVLRWLPRPVGYQGWWASIADHSPLHPPVFRLASRASSHGDSLRFLAKNKTDGVGFEPTNDFRRCRFSRSAKALRALPARTPMKTLPKRSSGRSRRAAETMAQRAKSSQIEARRANSRPLTGQVSDKSRSTCPKMTRIGGVMPPSLPCPALRPQRNRTPWGWGLPDAVRLRSRRWRGLRETEDGEGRRAIGTVAVG